MKITIEAETDAEMQQLDRAGLPHVQSWPLCYEFALFGTSATGRVVRSHGDHEFLECMLDWYKRVLGRAAAEHRRTAMREGE